MSSPLALAEGPGGAEGAGQEAGGEADRLGPGGALDGDVEMVGKIAADLGRVVDRGDAHRLQMVAGADAGEHQEMRRADGAGGEDDLATVGQRQVAGGEADAGGAAVGEEDAPDLLVGEDRQVRAVTDGVEEGASGREAAAVLLRDLVETDALSRVGVEIGGGGVPALGPGCDEGAGERVYQPEVADGKGAAGAVMRGAEGGVAFKVKEGLADGGPVPVRPRAGGPVAVVKRMAAHVDHCVDRA